LAEAITFVEQTGLKYRVGAMGTRIEGRRAPVFAAIANCHELPAISPVLAESRPLSISTIAWERQQVSWRGRSSPCG